MLPSSGETPERKRLYHQSCPHGHWFHSTQELMRQRQKGWRDEPMSEPEERKRLYHRNPPRGLNGEKGVYFVGAKIEEALAAGWQDVPIGEEVPEPAPEPETEPETEDEPEKKRKEPGKRLPRRGE